MNSNVRPLGKVRLLPTLALALACFPAYADRWVEYHRSGGGTAPNIEWELNEVDLDSITRDGNLLRYRVRVRWLNGRLGETFGMQADCVERTRGQLPEPRMSATYNGTLGREEVKMVCLVAAKEGR